MRAHLKKVIDNAAPQRKKQHDRNITGTIHRSKVHPGDESRRFTRHYTSCDNAVAFMTRFMLTNGYVGDVAELYNNVTGGWVGTIKMTAQGKLKTDFLWDRTE